MLNLYGLVVISLAACRIVLDKNYESALRLCEKGLRNLQETGCVVLDVIEAFVVKAEKERLGTLSGSPGFETGRKSVGSVKARAGRIPTNKMLEQVSLEKPTDVLITPAFESIVFKALFPAFIDSDTPTIKCTKTEIDQLRLKPIKPLATRVSRGRS
jgi:hypothetical protein